MLFSSRAATAQDNTGFDFRINDFLEALASERNDTRKDIINDSLLAVFDEFLSIEDNWNTSINNVRYLGCYISADSLMRMFSWNIPYSDGSNRYINIITRKDGSSTRTWRLDNNKGLEGISSAATLKEEEWYGALYYDILPFRNKDTTCYILLGIDFNNLFINSKVIEVLHFNDREEMLFGKPCIIDGEEVLSRLIFRYSAGASMLLRFDKARERIVFDHLAPAEPIYEGQYQYYGPDFTHDALVLKGGQWILTREIDIRNEER